MRRVLLLDSDGSDTGYEDIDRIPTPDLVCDCFANHNPSPPRASKKLARVRFTRISLEKEDNVTFHQLHPVLFEANALENDKQRQKPVGSLFV